MNSSSSFKPRNRPPKQALLGRARCKQQLGDAAGAEGLVCKVMKESLELWKKLQEKNA